LFATVSDVIVGAEGGASTVTANEFVVLSGGTPSSVTITVKMFVLGP
jgi:hypothetical protein